MRHLEGQLATDLSRKWALSRTSVPAHSARSASSGEEHDRIAQKVDVRSQRLLLLIGELRVRGVELDPGRVSVH